LRNAAHLVARAALAAEDMACQWSKGPKVIPACRRSASL
jgi:hypothetical protein